MNTRLSMARRILKLLHPEAIPRLGAIVYNRVSSGRMFQHHYELVARDILRYCSEGHLLDIGTGPGWLLIKLHRESPELHIVGVDVSRGMVAKARENMRNAGLGDVISIGEGNARSLPFEDNSFDIVVSTGSIHHWKEPVTGLNEVHRVLKQGGTALMYDLVSNTPLPILKEARQEYGRLCTTLFWLHSFEEPFYKREDFEALAAETFFKTGSTSFVGLFCCLLLRKNPAPDAEVQT
jgi:ubiquinone/menaquinone biosynthesis C-methylase UbiE